MTGSAPRLRLVTGRDTPGGDSETRFLAGVLTDAGWSVDIAQWSDRKTSWADADLTVLRSTWDYPRHLGAFLSWCRDAARRTAVHNPPALVEGNVDKRYLLALGAAGVPVIPTRWVSHPTPTVLTALSAEEGWPDLVVKPSVGVDGLGVRRWPGSGSEAADDRPRRPHGWIVQPFVPSVRTVGERSVVVLDGHAEWAVEKRPALDRGDIRVQERWGGSTATATADAEADAVACEALNASCPEGPPLYARIDLLMWDDGWHVTEVELIEPSLYLLEDRERARRVEAALRRRLER